MGKVKDFIEGNTYYIILVVTMLIVIGLSIRLNIAEHFFNFYKINYNGINTSFISFFGIVFGFLFASLAILFTLKEDSLFIKLIEENNRNRKDVITYFSIGIISSFLIVLLILFLTVIYISESTPTLTSLSQNLSKFPIYAVYYLVIFNLLNMVLLIFLFLLLLGSKRH